ncbi:MAG: hypothetical protein NC417_07085 [Candidatus Gastranaerophilales bacterium]|nr:hypothetical protein [Candidatus Gastranaerophilales bacterium]
MKEVIKIFKQIQETSSLNDKKAIITANKDNELFKECLKFLLDGNIVTGISTKKIKKKVTPSSELAPYYLCVHSTFKEVMKYLQKNNTGKDEDIYEIQSFLSGHEDDREFYEQMITKTFRLGADAKLVNKCIHGLITAFDVMLGTPIDKVRLMGDEWISISRKLNGTRCAFVGDKCMTRQGKEYKGLNHIIKDLHSLGLKNCFVDGELLYKNEEGLSDSEAFQKGTGIAMSKDNDKSDLKLVIFDVFPLEEFWTGKSKESYCKRKQKLLEIKADIKLFNDSRNIEVVQMCYEGTDHTEIWKWLDYAEENDWEGIILNLDTPYECKRTKNLIKVKHFLNCDIKCTGIEEGSGRNKGTCGALVCDYKGFPVNVGSGFSDDDRKHFWQYPEDVVGKIVSVKYKEETKNKDGGISIQFPVFESVRFDKSEPSYN